MASARTQLDERFAGPTLDPDVWVPYYLAHWSSRASSAATWRIEDGELRLSIPPDQPRWCPDLHAEPLRVSCIQSASYSGPAGSPHGPQPFRDGLLVQEEQPTLWGYTPHRGRLEIRMKARVDAASMFAFWLSGIEDQAHRSGEICVAEVFGSSIDGGAADVGMGIHRFRDPSLREDFATVQLELDTAAYHDYAIEWTTSDVTFFVDGHARRRIAQSPDYPMQLMIGIFDFPARRAEGAPAFTPELSVAHLKGSPA